MPIKPYKTILEQKEILKGRGLIISDDALFHDYILKNNYFNVVNGNEDLLLVHPGTSTKSYDTATFNDFIRLHRFDKELSSELISILHDFETRLKTSISQNFCARHCRVIQHTMQYTNKANFRNIKNLEGKNYVLYHDQYKNIVKDFDDFLFFSPAFLSTLVNKNDFINEKIFSVDSASYTPPVGCNSYKIDQDRKQVVVPLWVAIETLDFGKLQRLCHYLESDVLNDVLNDFNLGPTDKELFLNSLDVIRELRNKCAHFSLINRFYTPLSISILPSLINRLHLNPMEPARRVKLPYKRTRVLKNPAKLTLFDTLKVLGMYENLSRLKKPFKKIIYQNNKNFKRSTFDLNTRLLERMGNSSYNEWKKIFS